MNSSYGNSRTLPTGKIHCKRCHDYRPITAFAKNRLNAAQYLLARGATMNDARVKEQLICIICSGGPKLELLCTGCNKKRALSDFSANQRNAPDTARCKKCVAEIENIPAGHLKEKLDEDEDEYFMNFNGKGDMSVSGGGVRLRPENGYEALPSVARSTHGLTNMTSSARSTANTNTTIRTNAQPPRWEVKASGFVNIKKGHRDVHVPELMDDDVEVLDESDEEFDM